MSFAGREMEVAVIGAGPHGLSSALHLERAGVKAQVFGECMAFWRTMPEGMLLRSNWSASNIAEPAGPFSLDSYKAESGARFESPVPVEDFVAYGRWFQRRALPGADPRLVRRVTRDADGFRLVLDDGEEATATRVVVAAGIAPFVARPAGLDGLPAELVSHTSEHTDMGAFAGRRVGIVGGGQSAMECAALMQAGGAQVSVFIRRPHVVWLKANSPKNVLGPLGPVLYAPTDVGPLWYSRLVATPSVFRRLPRRTQDRIAYRSIRPACSNFVRVRLDDVELNMGSEVARVEAAGDGVRVRLKDGAQRELDHLVLGTGYRVDVARYPFLDPGLLAELDRVGGYPVLRRGLESSVPGLHFVGAPAARSFGPTMRFVSGSWYCGQTVARAIAGGARVEAAAR
jgi:cation diffusion facilitator CzcD-associated flavoprotein CzcO